MINVCAGNFTIPSVLRSAGFQGDIFACDVTLFTSALGAALTGQPLALRLRPDAPAPFGELVDLSTPEDAFASIALLYDLHMVWKMKNPFQARQVEGYRRNWPGLVARTKEKLAAYNAHLAGVRYAARDGFEVMKAADPAHTLITAPPIYKGGYERLDELINRCVEWDPPAYKPMLDTDLEPYELISRFEDYIVVLYKDLPEVYKLLGEPVAAILPKGRASYVMRIIAKRGPRLVVRPQTRSQPVGPFLPPDYRITGRERLTVAQLTLAQSIRMNQLFSAARVNTFTGGTDLSLAFMLDGRIFGKCDLCKSAHDWKFPGCRRHSSDGLPHERPRRALRDAASGQARLALRPFGRGQAGARPQARGRSPLRRHHRVLAAPGEHEVPGHLQDAQAHPGEGEGWI